MLEYANRPFPTILYQVTKLVKIHLIARHVNFWACADFFLRSFSLRVGVYQNEILEEPRQA